MTTPPAPGVGAANEASRFGGFGLVNWGAFILSGAWLAACAAYIHRTIGLSGFLHQPPPQLTAMLLGVAAVPVILGTGAAHWQRMRQLRLATELFERHSQKLSQVFDGQAKPQFVTGQGVVERLAVLMSGIEAHLAGMLQTVGQPADGQSEMTRLSQFGDLLRVQRDELSQLTDEMLNRLETVSGRFGTQVAEVREAERLLVGGIETIGTALVRTRGDQAEAARELEVLGERTSGLTVRLEGLRTAALNGAGEMMAEADRLHNRTQELSIELRSHGGVIEDSVTRASEIGAVLRGTSTLLSEITDRAADTSRQIRGEFETAVHTIGAEGDRLTERATQASGLLERTRVQMQDAVGDIETTLGGLDRRASEINFSVASSLTRLGELTRGIERARDEVTGSSGNIASHLDATMLTLNSGSEQVKSAANEVERIAERAETVIRRLEEAGESLKSGMDDVVATTDRAGQALRQSSQDFASSTNATRDQFGAIADRMAVEGASLDDALSRIVQVEAAMRDAGALVQQMSRLAAETTADAEAKLRATGQEITAQARIASGSSDMAGEALERTRGHIGAVTDQVNEAFGGLNRKASEINFAVSTVVNRLGELGRGLETARDAVTTAGDAASGRLSRTAEAIRGEFDGVQDLSNRALERLERTAAAIAAGAVNAESAAQTAEARVTALVTSIHERNGDLGHSVTVAIAEFERAERSLAAGQQRLTGTAEETAAQFLRLVRELANAKFDLGNTVTVSADSIANASVLVETRFAAIGRMAETAQAALGAFGVNLDQLSLRSEEVTRQLTDSGGAFNASIDSIKLVASNAGEELRRAAAMLVSGTSEIGDSAGRGKTEIQRIINTLREESRVIAESQEDARTLAGKAAAMLGEKAMEIAQAARLVATEAASLRSTDLRTRRDVFLGAAKSVLDELQSLSVDLSRVLDKDLPEKTWRTATRADMPAFTRRLAGLRDTLPVNEVRTRFMADTTFRSSVQAYLRQFEELLDQASADEQGDILTSALMSSDVGKIYYFLSGAVGRDRTLQQVG